MLESHDRFMAEAVALSRRGFPAPNPHVGCVIVQGGTIVGRGYHRFAGGPHAETVALDQAGSDSQGADVYVTLEPCAHRGRTPPCSEALVLAGVGRVFIACADPNPVAAGGRKHLEEAAVPTVMGVLEEEARQANAPFLFAHENKRPFVTVKVAQTVDGFMAKPDGSSQWITGEAARRQGHRLRAAMGAVLVGWKTVHNDDPRLTARIPGVRNQPVRIVLDPHARLNGRERLFHEEGESLWMVKKGTEKPGQTGADYGEGFDLVKLLSGLYARGITGVLVEGGPQTASAFLSAGLFEQFALFQSPQVFGDGLALTWNGAMVELGLQSVRKIGPDALITFRRKNGQQM